METTAMPFIVISILLSTINIVLRLLKSKKFVWKTSLRINLNKLEEKQKKLEASVNGDISSDKIDINDIISETENILEDLVDLFEKLEFR